MPTENRMKKSVLAILVLLSAHLPGQEKIDYLPAPVVTQPTAKHSDMSPRVRSWQGIPSMACTRRGRQFAGWLTGGDAEPDKRNFNVLVHSDDGGISWSKPVLAIESIAGENVCSVDIQLWVDPENRLWAFWTQRHHNLPPESFQWIQGWAVVCDDPDAAELKWSEPKFIAPGFLRNKPTVLSDGRWLMCAWSRHGDRYQYAESKDRGATWTLRRGPVIPPQYRKDYGEMMVLERRDGSLWMLSRVSAGVIYQATSADGGATWSDATPTELVSPSTRFFIGRLASGRVLLIKNNHPRVRCNLTAYLSEDDGRTWKHAMLLEAGYCTYPDAQEGSDGMIYMIYDHGRYTKGEICYSRFTERDVKAGKLVNPNSYLGQIVSKSIGNRTIFCSGKPTQDWVNAQLPAFDWGAEERICELDADRLPMLENVRHTVVQWPDDEYGFLHEAAIVSYKGTLFASWYNCPRYELSGTSVIRGRRSRDNGRTWSDIEVLGADKTGRLLYCPPVYGVVDGRLYLFMNTMTRADHMHSLELYRYDDASGAFTFVWSRAIPFKLNTNVVKLPNGKLMLPGRASPKLDGFPTTPAVLISDSGTCEGPWRLVRVAEDGELPDRLRQEHAETAVVALGAEGRLLIFCRGPKRDLSLLYRSSDFGETWSPPIPNDGMPFSDSKIYSGTLADGRHYVVGNLRDKGDRLSRSRLAIYFTEPNGERFTKGYLIRSGDDARMKVYPQFSYPFCDTDGANLYVIYTMVAEKGNQSRRGAMLSVIPLK